MKAATILFAIALAVASTVSFGQQKPEATAEAAYVNLVGDFFKFNARVLGFVPADTGGDARTAPKDSCFRVNKELEKPDPTDDTKKAKFVLGTFATGWFPNLLFPPYRCRDDLGEIDPDESYEVLAQTLLQDRDRNRFGATYGILVAPFKFYWSEREFSAGASVGPYLGYRMYDRQGSASVLALSVGAASATVKTDNPDGSSSSTQRTGMSFAFAYLLEIKRDFNVGAIFGKDYFSKSDNIPSSGKLWVSLSFGRKID